MEVSLVRNRLRIAITAAREAAKVRREHRANAERTYDVFLQTVAVPLAQQVVNVLRTEGHAFTLSTPSGGLRIAEDRGRDDYIELALDTADPPQVIGRTRSTRGSRTLTDERPVKPGAAPDAISEEDVLAFLLGALEPWLAR